MRSHEITLYFDTNININIGNVWLGDLICQYFLLKIKNAIILLQKSSSLKLSIINVFTFLDSLYNETKVLSSMCCYSNAIANWNSSSAFNVFPQQLICYEMFALIILKSQ